MKVRFDQFLVDAGSRQLLRDREPLHLTPKAFDLLWLLIERRPNVVSKADIHARIWPGVAVTDASLNVVVREVRQVLGDDAAQQAFVRTASRIGYAFCAEVAEGEPAEAAASCSVVWRGKAQPLADGENVLGRGGRCDVQVDDESVSRRHAKIQIDAAALTATVEDLDSTNGTYLGRELVEGPAVLSDGDTIKLGTATLKVRLWAKGESETTRVKRKR